MLQKAYFLAKIGADTAENEQHFAEILPIGRRVAAEKLTRSARALPGPAAADAPDAGAGGVLRRVAVRGGGGDRPWFITQKR